MFQVRFPLTLSDLAQSLLQGLLQKEPARRLGGGPRDAEEIKEHPFFSPINWEDLEAKKVTINFLSCQPTMFSCSIVNTFARTRGYCVLHYNICHVFFFTACI